MSKNFPYLAIPGQNLGQNAKVTLMLLVSSERMSPIVKSKTKMIVIRCVSFYSNSALSVKRRYSNCRLRQKTVLTMIQLKYGEYNKGKYGFYKGVIEEDI